MFRWLLPLQHRDWQHHWLLSAPAPLHLGALVSRALADNRQCRRLGKRLGKCYLAKTVHNGHSRSRNDTCVADAVVSHDAAAQHQLESTMHEHTSDTSMQEVLTVRLRELLTSLDRPHRPKLDIQRLWHKTN